MFNIKSKFNFSVLSFAMLSSLIFYGHVAYGEKIHIYLMAEVEKDNIAQYRYRVLVKPDEVEAISGLVLYHEIAGCSKTGFQNFLREFRKLAEQKKEDAVYINEPDDVVFSSFETAKIGFNTLVNYWRSVEQQYAQCSRRDNDLSGFSDSRSGRQDDSENSIAGFGSPPSPAQSSSRASYPPTVDCDSKQSQSDFFRVPQPQEVQVDPVASTGLSPGFDGVHRQGACCHCVVL